MKGRFMTRSLKWALALCVLLVMPFAVAACGGDDDGGGDEQAADEGTPAQGQKGGTLVSLWAGDVDFIDPGATYYQMGTQIVRATQKTLYTPKIDDATVAEPDMAEADPEVAEDGCTVTVSLKTGVKFSPPVDREVTSADVKYAIERGFFNTVNNGYAGAYFGSIDGAEVGVDPGTEIPGIETPDDSTVVFNLKPAEGEDRCPGGVVAGALQMPLSAPVPKEYAAPHDEQNPSAYGQNQVATGPYMIENNAQGKAIGYQAGRRIHLVRNPNWDASLDNDPAYVDEIDIRQGNDDPTVMSREILGGQSMINGDQPPPPAVLKQALTRDKENLQLVPSGGGRWISMNTTVEPFDDINVRKAVAAGMDRDALRLTRGGEVVGDIPTHYIPPEMVGFEEAGGMEGPGIDFMANPKGDKELSAEYFRKAGFDSGRYEGDEELLMVGDNEGVGAQTAQVAAQQLEEMGFSVKLRQVTHDAMYTKFCNRPSANVALCPNVGWLKDFPDPQTFLDPTFNGTHILKQGNSNWSELDVPEINQAMADASLLTDPAERAEAWGEIDRMITEQAPAIMWIWDKQSNIKSDNVVGVVDEDNALWSLSHTSIR
jgi:peptide/nickel transport system substrate-binding protein